MYASKTNIFNYLTKSQKSDFCTHVSKFVKRHQDKSEQEILDLIMEEEAYYIEIGNSRHFWIEEHLDNETFIRDVKLYIRENIRKYEYKEAQKPFIEKQKAFQKQQRKQMQEYKMDREEPTKAQISYYKALCRERKISVDIVDVENASKLDLRNAIDELLSEKEIAEKQALLSKLNELIEEKKLD